MHICCVHSEPEVAVAAGRHGDNERAPGLCLFRDLLLCPHLIQGLEQALDCSRRRAWAEAQ